MSFAVSGKVQRAVDATEAKYWPESADTIRRQAQNCRRPAVICPRKSVAGDRHRGLVGAEWGHFGDAHGPKIKSRATCEGYGHWPKAAPALMRNSAPYMSKLLPWIWPGRSVKITAN